MPRLILFELKKMLSRRVALAANVGVVLFLAAIMALNVVQARTTDASGAILSGTDAIAQSRLEAGAHAGAITPERAAADIAAYQERLFSRIDRGEVTQMTGSAVYDLMFQSFSDEEVYELYNPYWSWLLRPWRVSGEEPAQTAARVTPEMAADWYGAVAGLTQDALDDGQAGMWEYGQAERAYWTDKQADVAEPIEYGYVGGWEIIISCAAFLVFAILAVCVTLASTFSFEYQSGADARLRDRLFRALCGADHRRLARPLRGGWLRTLDPEHGAHLALSAHGGAGGPRLGRAHVRDVPRLCVPHARPLLAHPLDARRLSRGRGARPAHGARALGRHRGP